MAWSCRLLFGAASCSYRIPIGWLILCTTVMQWQNYIPCQVTRCVVHFASLGWVEANFCVLFPARDIDGYLAGWKKNGVMLLFASGWRSEFFTLVRCALPIMWEEDFLLYFIFNFKWPAQKSWTDVRICRGWYSAEWMVKQISALRFDWSFVLIRFLFFLFWLFCTFAIFSHQ